MSFVRGSFFALMSCLALSQAKAACNASLKVINEASSPMISIMAKNSGKTDWTPAMSPADAKVAPNDSVVINPGDGSDAVLYDFLFLFANGQVYPQEKINVCDTGLLRVRPVATTAASQEASPPPAPRVPVVQAPPPVFSRQPPPARSPQSISLRHCCEQVRDWNILFYQEALYTTGRTCTSCA